MVYLLGITTILSFIFVVIFYLDAKGLANWVKENHNFILYLRRRLVEKGMDDLVRDIDNYLFNEVEKS